MSKAISLGLMAGFGWIPAVSLSEARDKAHAARQQLAGDIDPIGQFSHHAAPTVTDIASDPQADPTTQAWIAARQHAAARHQSA